MEEKPKIEPYFRVHVFCCTNKRPDGHLRGSCAAKGSVKLRDYMKARAKELGLKDVRINSSGCLDRCEEGPAIVIYPGGIWYTVNSFDDVDEILQKHLLKGGRARNLLMPNSSNTDCSKIDDYGCADCDGC